MNQKRAGHLNLIYEYRFVIITVLAFMLFLYFDPSEVYKIFRSTPTFFYNTNRKERWFYSFDDFLSFYHICLLATVYVVTTFFGYTFLQGFFRHLRVNILIKFAASFLVGYVSSLAVIRFVSYFLPNGSVFYPTIIAILIISIIQFKSNLPLDTEERKPPDWSAIFGSFFFLSFLFFLFLIIQVYAGEFAWVGHGPHQYSWVLTFLRESKEASHFPIVVQHYDELLYTYMILDPIKISFNAILPMWVTLALNKVSFFALLYCLFRFLKLKPYQAAVGSLFIFFGTNALDPSKYLMLFDSSNPAAYIVHSTRIVGIAVALLVIVSTLCCGKEPGFLKLPFFIFTAVGLIFTAISNSPLILALFFIALLLSLYPKVCTSLVSNFRFKKIRIEPIYIVHFVFLSCALGYGILNTDIYIVPGLVHMAAGILLFCAYAFFIFLNRKTDLELKLRLNEQTKSGLKFFAAFFLTTIFSALFLGNLFSNNALNFFVVRLLNKYTFIDGLWIGNVVNTTYLHKFAAFGIFKDGRWFSLYNEYCMGFFYFLAYYGSIYILALCAFWSRVKSEVDDCTLKLKGLLLLTISMLPFLFFHYDFLIYTDKAWPKSRFLEIPIYFIIFSSIVLVFKSRMKSIRGLFCIFLLIYIVIPILGTHRLEQWINNAVALSSYLK